ncbi:delta 9-fatty acid desaturase protein [Ephemerocybe angulata]|uniref:Acyl-CoA desaturase n=1 Tax=Ephemerocybe angulata TaxID=980116 RepID=A0A8H6I2J4_9AGAR|nr:delta 9-fatty acid desaturase protein [Tulosesus angulatus]
MGSPSSAAIDDIVPSDLNIPDNYVQHTLRTQKLRPPVTLNNLLGELNYISCTFVLLPPVIGLIGACYTPLVWKTALFSVLYYFVTGLGITAGIPPALGAPELQCVVAPAGSIKWWSRGHRAHHRYTDTDLDPYNAHKGFFYSHIGWMLVKPRRKPGVADVSDLGKDPVSTFCVNSLAHWLGETPFDDKHTPRDHFITALVTVGEGYHNFHHQFPMDYRNAIKWYQYDPTKWFIATMKMLGFASHLKTFPDNEVRKGQLTMELKKLHRTQEKLEWPSDSNDLPVISWDSYQEQSKNRPLVLISGFIHDVSTFIHEHPGGSHLIIKFIGKDATTAFFGGVYDHSNAAHNLLAMKRVGVLHGGMPHGLDEKVVPPSQRLKIARYNELSSAYSSYSESEGGLLG